MVSLWLMFCGTAWAGEVRTLLVFGDSLAAGYGIRAEQAWPALLGQRLGTGWRVVNASQSGETTAGGLTRLPQALATHKPSIVVLELGANDGLRGLSIDTARRNLAKMIELAQAQRARVVLVGMQLPPNFGPAYTQKFASLFEELARQYQLPKPPFLLEGIADRPELFQADQLHPVAAAQPRLLENVWPAVARAVGRS
jgi:acyl-CoA thioesterase-1